MKESEETRIEWRDKNERARRVGEKKTEQRMVAEPRSQSWIRRKGWSCIRDLARCLKT